MFRGSCFTTFLSSAETGEQFRPSPSWGSVAQVNRLCNPALLCQQFNLSLRALQKFRRLFLREKFRGCECRVLHRFALIVSFESGSRLFRVPSQCGELFKLRRFPVHSAHEKSREPNDSRPQKFFWIVQIRMNNLNNAFEQSTVLAIEFPQGSIALLECFNGS